MSERYPPCAARWLGRVYYQNAWTLHLDGQESYDIEGVDGGRSDTVTITATKANGEQTQFDARVRIDTPKEREYFVNGGILHYVLRQLAEADRAA